VDFSPQQKYNLLTAMGYSGSSQAPEMDAFVQSNPRAAALMGKFTRVVKKRAGMVEGGVVGSPPQSDGSKLAETIIQQPEALTTKAEVAKVDISPNTLISDTVGKVETPATTTATTVDTTAKAETPTAAPAATVEATNVAADVAKVANETQAVTGEVRAENLVTAAQGNLSSGATATADTFDRSNLQTVQAGTLGVGDKEIVSPAGQTATAIKTEVAQSEGVAQAVAEAGTVQANELPVAAQIKDSEMAQATAVVSAGLSADATAVAAKLEKFSVSNETLAEAMQGKVGPLDTVQGQLSELMKSFNDGTPAWAAGAIRGANAAMNARGLGGSSMAGAAILQAAMESAIPIASQDADTFNKMNLQNLNNRQQVSLANAAAQQGLQLQNLNNEQQAALQNSSNSFSLQSQNLSNMQSTIIANAQIKAALQGQNLSNQQQANLATAARYAEVANVNLNNRQQTMLQNNMNAVNTDLANLSARQQAYVTNANIAATLQGQQISNQQQAAIANASRYSEAANITFTAGQQAALHNSTLMQTIGLADLDAKKAATLQNAATTAQMDITNLNNRQQAAVQNANAFLQIDMTNLNNEQQTEIFRAQANVNAILTDGAAQNAAKQFNASSENQTNQFYDGLTANVSQFNANQTNAMKQFNAGAVNAADQFNTQLEAQRNQFNATNGLVIAQANAVWRQNATTMDTAAQNNANAAAALNMNGLTTRAMDEIWQTERDHLAFAFTTVESDKDRAAQLLLGNKQLDASAKAASDAEKGAQAAILAKIIFGDW
jgi:hypothetical protein